MTEQNGFRDFESMSDKQRQKHYEAVCAAAGLDPALNLLKWTRMDDGSGTGAKRLVLYATKGATNAIRSIQGIDVTGLVDKTVAGAYVVTATARNAKGRVDMATGAASLEGRRGRSLENAFALAQTRATRRVTLQMSGLDLLDESEVTSDGTTPIADAPLPLDQIGAPVEINGESGIDITPPVGLTLKAPAVAQASASATLATDTPERLPNPATGLKLATANLEGPSGTVRPTKTTTEQPETVSEQTQSTEMPKQRRKRRTKAEMEAARTQSPSETLQAELEPLPNEGGAVTAAPSTTAASPAPNESAMSATMSATPQPVKVNLSSDIPTQEQMKVYVARLTKYREEILPNGGMIPSHGMGINKKLRAFFSVANNNTEELTSLTVAQWDATFGCMDSVLAQKGPKELVAIIETNIGAVDEPVNS